MSVFVLPRSISASAVWVLLWVWTVTVLLVKVKVPDDRVNLPYFQYLFFAGIVLAVACLLQRSQLPDLFQLARKYTALLALAVVFTISASAGLDPWFGLRLLGIIAITSLPFLLIGHGHGISGVQQLVAPVFHLSWVIAACAVFLEYVGPVTVLTYTLDNSYQFEGQGKDWRWTFLFNEAPGLGYMMAVGINAALASLTLSSSKLARLGIGLIALPLMTYVLAMTNTRAAILWAGFALFAYAIFFLGKAVQRGLSKWSLGLGAAMAILVVGYLLVTYSAELQTYLRLDSARRTYIPGGIDSFRFTIWSIYWAHFLAHPLLGFGFGATDQLAVTLPGAGPANAYVGILGESGAVALLLVLWMWAKSIVRALGIVRREWAGESRLCHSAFWVSVMLIGLALQQLGEWSLFHVSPLHYLFIVLVAASTSAEVPIAGLRKARLR